MGLRDKLFDTAKSLREKLSEAITGSYETKKLNDKQSVITETPNIFERIGGKKTEEYIVREQEPRPEAKMPFVPSLNPEWAQNKLEDTPEIMEPRKENLFNKARAKIEDVFDGEEAATSLPEGAVKIKAEDDAPEGVNIERINGELYMWPKEDAVKINAEDEAPEGSNVERIGEDLYTWPKATISIPDIKEEHKEPIIKGAQSVGVDPTIIAKLLRGEGLNSTPQQLEEAKKREGAIGPGQHRKIFYDTWNPEFKERYGRDYDRNNLTDVATVTSMAIKHYMEKYGTLEAALVAYNKGESVVQDYIDDPNVSMEEDPYVIGFKNR